MLDGALYIVNGAWAEGTGPRQPRNGALLRIDGGQVSEVANTWDIEESGNPAGAVVETHPYGIAVGPDGWIWIADAAGNSLFGVSMGTFTEQGPTPGSGAVIRIGPGETSEPVLAGLQLPTAVAFDADGNAYVVISGLGQPGAGRVVKYPNVISGGG